MSWLISKALLDDYENSHCLPEPGAGFLGEGCSAGEPSALLNVMPTPHKFWFRDKTIDHSNLSRFGLTLRVLTDDLGGELLTWFREGFRAKTYQPQEKERGLTANEVDSGQSLRESYAKYDPDTCSWRTPQCSLFEDLPECLVTLPRWGSMLNGELYRRKIAGPCMNVNGRGLWPTLTKSDYAGRRPSENWQGNDLPSHVWRRNGGLTNPEKPPVRLNEEWCEWFMGFPHGWTGLEPLGMLKYPCVPQPHGEFSEVAS